MIKKIPKETATFRFYNANPKDRRTSDCVIRAISTATGKSWDEVLDELLPIAHKYKVMIDDPHCYDRYLTALGFTKMKQPRKWDNTKYTGSDFARYLTAHYPEPNTVDVVAHIGGHHIVAIAPVFETNTLKQVYKVLDTWDSTDGSIGNYWIRQL